MLTKVSLKDKNIAIVLTINLRTYHFFLSKHDYDQIKVFRTILPSFQFMWCNVLS